MDISFCKGCENMLYIHVDSETNELYNACKACGNIEKMKDMSHHIYSTNTQNKIDKSEIINLNQYISHDITLPIIKNCNISVCNDTSFSHLSAALGVETIVLMTDTPLLYGSYSSKMHPILPDGEKIVTHDTLGKYKINSEKIFNKLKNILNLN